MRGDPTLHWRGINHLALVTNDMDATVRFYHGVLGAELVATVGTPTFRHYFFSFGEQCTVAFFEYADTKIEPFAKPAGVPDPRAIQFDHLSFNLPDEEALLALPRPPQARRLRGHRRRRPRLHPVRVLHRPERHRPRGVVVDRRRHRARRRLRRRPPVRRLRTRCRRWSSCARRASWPASRRPGSSDRRGAHHRRPLRRHPRRQPAPPDRAGRAPRPAQPRRGRRPGRAARRRRGRHRRRHRPPGGGRHRQSATTASRPARASSPTSSTA